MTYFVSNRYEGCWYYRCYLPMLFNGFRGDKISPLSPKITAQESFEIAKNADTVVFQRPDERGRLEAALMLKSLGKKIVFDNDDTYRGGESEGKFAKFYKKREIIIDEFIKIADLVTTTTEFLADEYRKLNKNVMVLPNCINPMDWPAPKRNETDVVRIGVVGSAAMNDDFKQIRKLLKSLSKRKDVKLVLFGLPFKNEDTKLITKLYKREARFWGHLDVEWQPFVKLSDYFRTLNDLKLDLMLIPRADNYFNRCKSNCKFLEASMLEIPVIAQGFSDGKSPYQGTEDREHMIICYSKRDWESAVEFMIKNPDARRNLGRRAKKYVLENYNIENKFKAWKEAYAKI